MTINKQDIIRSVSIRTGEPILKSRTFVDATFSEIQKAILTKTPVRLTGIGVFEPTVRRGRVGRNPRTGETVMIASKTGVKFRPSVTIREAL